jgi:hypothetical protein
MGNICTMPADILSKLEVILLFTIDQWSYVQLCSGLNLFYTTTHQSKVGTNLFILSGPLALC